MKRLTLEEAVGQTLLAKVVIGEDTLLRFTAGVVRLYTHYESYVIRDYTDGSHPLDNLQRYIDETLDELHAAGFIDGHEKFAAVTKREEDLRVYEQRREEDLRKQYESLKERFEPK